ncbi:MAG: hypothetical protein LGR52_13700 [Candidatus Thiosymbion ectosymbiont of Robbea hypermnestra]|nr:hypothetical protein [Candidatus Thiosymbion ectosymbiont of Robbea hypermnestra]
MNTQAVTLNEIRKLGIEALTTHLGAVGMIRFLQQGETEWGDYTNDREKWLGNPTLEEIYGEIQNLTKEEMGSGLDP